MKLTSDNLEKIFNYIDSQLSDEDSGEFDEETPILSAVDRTIEMFEENSKMKYKVKLEVIETHYLDIDADNVADAAEQARSYGVNSQDAHHTNLDVISVEELK
tara:strand:+ start:890 stop:1198 length:309 start_codon:yes stop_codon:yes gene_type:complete